MSKTTEYRVLACKTVRYPCESREAMEMLFEALKHAGIQCAIERKLDGSDWSKGISWKLEAKDDE